MEKKLRKLFEYQRFVQDKSLQKQIDEVLIKKDNYVLSDDLLGAIAGGKQVEEDKHQSSK